MKLHTLTAAIAVALTAQLYAATPVPAATDSVPTDTVATSPPKASMPGYPERLLTDFPVIYTDTAYTTPHYHVVLRAVWMSKRGRKCKVSSPGQLPEPRDARMVRFVTRP